MSWFSSTRLAGRVAVCLATAASPFAAHATEGYFALGFGPVQRGAGGAGVAVSTDAMGAALNPASVADVGKELTFGAEIFAPDRGYSGDTYFVAPGGVRSDSPVFLVPNFAYNLPLANGDVLNVAAYGNGGMNTDYADVANPNCANLPSMIPPGFDMVVPPGFTGSGVFCGGRAGVDLNQLFVQLTYAGKAGPVSWGIAPVLAVQRFRADGLALFTARDSGGAPVFSADPDHMTNQGYDFSTGGGLRAGIQVELSPTFSLGVSGQTKFKMSKFDKYAGLFEGGGSFDIPASVTVGAAMKASPSVRVMLDYQRIYYSGVPAISNATDAGAFGAPGGAGFGWDDVDVVKLGVEWAASPTMTWRAGYAHATNPIGPEDVTLNILAPGVVQDHFTFGGSRKMGASSTLDFAVVYVPDSSVSGPEVTPFGPTGQNVKLDMHQASVSVGWRTTF